MQVCHWLRSCKSSLNRQMCRMPKLDTPRSYSKEHQQNRGKTMQAIDITKEEKEMNAHRNMARITGILFFAGTVTGLPTSFTESIVNAPNYLTSISAHSTQVLIGALFAFIAAVVSGSIAISLYPVLKKYHEALALGAVGFRLIEAVFYIVNIIGV